MDAEHELDRLRAAREGGARWKRWGPYLSERQWGTVREDYSERGDAWNCFTHDHARSRAYRWGEDGLAGFCDDQQQLCVALALWNGADPILKERAVARNVTVRSAFVDLPPWERHFLTIVSSSAISQASANDQEGCSAPALQSP